MRLLRLAALIGSAWLAPALAALPTVPSPPATPAATGGFGLLQALAALALIIGLIFAAGALARRFGLHRIGNAGPLSVVSSAALGPRERVVIVEVAGEWLVLGVTPSQVTALHRLPAQATTAVATGAAASTNLGAQFASRFKAALGKSPTSP